MSRFDESQGPTTSLGAVTYVYDVVAGDAAVVAAHAMQTEQAEASFYALGVGCAVNRYGMPPLGHMLAVALCCCSLLPNWCMPIYQVATCSVGMMQTSSVPTATELMQLLCMSVCIIQAFFDQVAPLLQD